MAADPNNDDYKKYLDLVREINPGLSDEEAAKAAQRLRDSFPSQAPSETLLKFDPKITRKISDATGLDIDPEKGVSLSQLQSAILARALTGGSAPIRNLGMSAADKQKEAERKLPLSQRMAQGASPEFAALKNRSDLVKAVNTPEALRTDAQKSLVAGEAGQELAGRFQRAAEEHRARTGWLQERLATNPAVQAAIARRDAADAAAGKTKLFGNQLLKADGSPLDHGVVFTGELTAKQQAYLDTVRSQQNQEQAQKARDKRLNDRLAEIIRRRRRNRQINTRQS